MNNDLLMALKKLLEYSINNNLLPNVGDEEVKFSLPTPPEIDIQKAVSVDSFRVLHELERQQFSDDGLYYYYHLQKLIYLSRSAQEQLLNMLLDQESDKKITVNTIKWAILSMTPKDLTPIEYAFLDFVLTPNLDPTQ